MRRISTTLLAPVALALAVAACATDDVAETPERLTIIAHDSFARGADDIGAFDAFTEETGIEVEVLAGGDAGSVVTQAVLTKDNPLADVLFGVDDTFLSRALDEEIFRPYRSELIGTVPADLVDPEDLVTPIDFGDVCINYDREWFEEAGVEIPTSLDDFRTSPSAENLVVQHPATSSPGLAFMLATIDIYGEEGWLEFWADLREGGVSVASDWDSAYYGEFIRHGGDNPLVVSYASSPPAEVIFAEEPVDTSPTGVVEAGCYRQVEYAGVLEGTDYPEAAGELVDYMLSVEFQEMIPLTWFVFPVNEDASLPQEFVDHTVIPESPTRLSAEAIAENRDRWIDEWISLMER